MGRCVGGVDVELMFRVQCAVEVSVLMEGAEDLSGWSCRNVV